MGWNDFEELLRALRFRNLDPLLAVIRLMVFFRGCPLGLGTGLGHTQNGC